jgi:hypothetical protein
MSAQQSAGNGGMLGLDHARGHTYSPKPSDRGSAMAALSCTLPPPLPQSASVRTHSRRSGAKPSPRDSRGGYARDRSAPLERWMNRIGLRLAPLAAHRLADREHQAASP